MAKAAAAVLALAAMSAHAAAADTQAGATQCRADEPVLFSCETGKKVVSLCGAGKTTRLASITYRYGTPGNVELEYTATLANGHLFHGLVEPAAPDASVREVWFDNGTTRYLLTTCEGGGCAYEAGLAVLRGGQVVSRSRCVRSSPDRAFFDTDMVDFGSGLADSRSATPLLRLGQEDNKLRDDAAFAFVRSGSSPHWRPLVQQARTSRAFGQGVPADVVTTWLASSGDGSVGRYVDLDVTASATAAAH